MVPLRGNRRRGLCLQVDVGRLLLVGAVLYRPFLRFRVKRGFTAFLVEYWLRDLVLHNIGRRVQKAAGSRRRSARVPRA